MQYKDSLIAVSIGLKSSVMISLILSFTSNSLGIGGMYDEPPILTGIPRIRPP